MKNDGLVSVIIPVYNAEKYISECLNSVCNQTYFNLEIIIVNDGSTDNSDKICNEYQYTDDRIKIIKQSHLGVAAARNVAVTHTCGEFICFVDADDFIDATMIEKMHNLLVMHQCDIIQCNYLRVEDSFQAIRHDSILKNSLNIYTRKEALWKLQAGKQRVSMMLWNKLYRRNIWNEIICPIGKIYEDDAVIHRLLFNAEKVGIMNEILYYQRMSLNSIIRSKFSFNRYDYIDAMVDRYEFFMSIGEVECAYVTIQKMAVKIIELYRETIRFYPNEKNRLRYLQNIYRKYWDMLKFSPFLSDELWQKHFIWLDFPEKGTLYEFTDYSCMYERSK